MTVPAPAGDDPPSHPADDPPDGPDDDTGSHAAVPQRVDRRDVKAVQAAYHDWEASTYDDKFGISFDDHVTDYAVGRWRRGFGDARADGTVLEVGAGTGFFSLNLARAGIVTGDLHVTDLSPGMVEVCRRNAAANDLAVTGHVADAEALPFDDDSFDVVVGHAVLHHLPVPGVAIREAFRVLRPGGRLLVAGEPTHWGDRASWVVKQNTWRAFRLVTSIPPLDRVRRPDDDHGTDDAELASLEHDVDLHTFHPDEFERMAAIAGFVDVHVRTEELLANWWGWAMRTLEGSMAPAAFTPRWAMTSFRGYQLATRFDEAVLQHVVPRGLFYNLVLAARKPLATGTG